MQKRQMRGNPNTKKALEKQKAYHSHQEKIKKRNLQSRYNKTRQAQTTTRRYTAGKSMHIQQYRIQY